MRKSPLAAPLLDNGGGGSSDEDASPARNRIPSQTTRDQMWRMSVSPATLQDKQRRIYKLPLSGLWCDDCNEPAHGLPRHLRETIKEKEALIKALRSVVTELKLEKIQWNRLWCFECNEPAHGLHKRARDAIIKHSAALKNLTDCVTDKEKEGPPVAVNQLRLSIQVTKAAALFKNGVKAKEPAAEEKTPGLGSNVAFFRVPPPVAVEGKEISFASFMRATDDVAGVTASGPRQANLNRVAMGRPDQRGSRTLSSTPPRTTQAPGMAELYRVPPHHLGRVPFSPSDQQLQPRQVIPLFGDQVFLPTNAPGNALRGPGGDESAGAAGEVPCKERATSGDEPACPAPECPLRRASSPKLLERQGSPSGFRVVRCTVTKR